MPYKFIDEGEAPEAPPKSAPSRARYFHQILDELPEGKVAAIEPEGQQSLRGIKVSVGRVASSKKIDIQSWDDGSRVYVKRLSN